MSEVKRRVRTFILENFLMGGDHRTIGDEDSFLAQRVLDSTGFIELVTFLEKTFEITVDDEEMLPENLDTVNNIDAYVSRKRSRTP